MSMDNLIYYSNSYLEETIHDDEFNSQITMLPPFDLKDESFSIQDGYFLEPLYNSNELFLPEMNSYQEFNNFQNYPKRQKIYQDDFFLNGVVPNPPILQELTSFLMPEFQNLPVYRTENGVGMKVSTVKKNLSSQSIAATQRRKKISEKTEELRKLIPGGHKMNTADMFQAAYMYINFLQAQVGILEVMGSYQERGEQFQTPELNNLVGAPLIQEKLYSSEE
ncbi:transcription factor bHLH52-like [Lycium ferocissimum]|uniref:transcription factor bHLH52-like n=1 Tax=Lycium ferocissimum TaxID=112874 RepID=UPI0028161AE8|nr:transcription factor bHLH52-like [Lycium ferocissimum]